MTTQQQSKEQQIWEDMLSGTLTFEEGRVALTALRGATAANSLVEAARAERQKGLEAGAAWAKTPEPLTELQKPLTELQKGFLQENPAIEFNRAFNLPVTGGNPFQKWLSSQVGTMFSPYAARNVLNISSGRSPEAFQKYLDPRGGGLGLAGQTALGAFNQARSLAPEGQGDFLEQFRGEGGAGGNLRDFLQSALQGRGFASPFARAAARQAPDYEQQWAQNTLGGNVPGASTLLEYLAQRLGF